MQTFGVNSYSPKNVLLDADTTPVLTDFELSKFGGTPTNFWMDLTRLFDDLAMHVRGGWADQLDRITRQHVILNRAIDKPPDAATRDAIVGVLSQSL